MSVKRFVSRFFRKDEPDNRIRAMWEPEAWEQQWRRVQAQRTIAWAILVGALFGLVVQTVL